MQIVPLIAMVTTGSDPPGASPVSANLELMAVTVGLLLVSLLVGSLLLLFLALRETARGRPPSLETSWGGFGGGLGGWHLSPALTYLLAALFLGGLLGVLAVRVMDSPAFHAWAGVPLVEETETGARDEASASPAEEDDGPAEAGDGAEGPASGEEAVPSTPAPDGEG